MQNWANKLRQDLHEVLSVQIDEAAQKIGNTINKVIDYSPTLGDSKAGYATGEFLKNWKVDNTVFAGYTTETQPSRADRKAELVAQLQQALLAWKDGNKKNESVFLYNNSPYAMRVEYIGWNTTSPYAPVARAVSEFE